jgi:hypothetical protein
LKFPPKVSKAEKIMGLEWRFTQFRIKLPIDRHSRNPGYERLFYEIENSTEDLALLDHDDCVDSLAMHQAIGKPHQAIAADIMPEVDPIKLLRQGVYVHEATGISVLSGLNASEIPADVLGKMMHERYERERDEAGLTDEDIETNAVLQAMGLAGNFFQAED